MALSFALSLALSNPGDTQTCQKISVRVHSRARRARRARRAADGEHAATLVLFFTRAGRAGRLMHPMWIVHPGASRLPPIRAPNRSTSLACGATVCLPACATPTPQRAVATSVLTKLRAPPSPFAPPLLRVNPPGGFNCR